jgi:hypothetical protein
VKVTVSHNKTKEEVMRTVDRSFEDLFKNVGSLPVRLLNEKHSWQGSTLTFSLTASMGLLSTPINGTVDVTDHDVTVEVDLGLLERMISRDKAREMIGSRVKGLLK